jgi:hypothetical protein
VEGILATKITDPRITEWPGPIASLLLRRINLGTLRDTYIVGKESVASGRLWEAEFYKAILLREDEETKECSKILSHLVDTSLEEWNNQSFFERRIRTEEFFIARFEIGG